MNISKEGTPPNQPPGYYSRPGSGQDEISLLDIWQALKRQWRLIVAITFSVTLVALIVALMMPKIYRAEIVLLPPLESDVEVLNIPKLYEITAEDLYQKMIRNLHSNELRYRFFKEHKLFATLKGEKGTESDSYKVFQNKFNNLLVVKVFSGKNKKSDLGIATVSLDGVHYKQITSWVNKYVAFVDAITTQFVFSAIDSKIMVQETSIRRRIDSLRVVAKKQRFDFVAHLNEAIFVADKLGFNEQNSNLYVNNLSEKGNLEIVLNATEVPLYTRGSKALRANVKALKSRGNDDPFIDGLRELEGELVLLEKISLKNKNVHAARIDQRAVPDDVPVKPKRKLIVVLGFMIGAMLAVVMVMIRVFLLQKMEE